MSGDYSADCSGRLSSVRPQQLRMSHLSLFSAVCSSVGSSKRGQATWEPHCTVRVAEGVACERAMAGVVTDLLGVEFVTILFVAVFLVYF